MLLCEQFISDPLYQKTRYGFSTLLSPSYPPMYSWQSPSVVGWAPPILRVDTGLVIRFICATARRCCPDQLIAPGWVIIDERKSWGQKQRVCLDSASPVHPIVKFGTILAAIHCISRRSGHVEIHINAKGRIDVSDKRTEKNEVSAREVGRALGFNICSIIHILTVTQKLMIHIQTERHTLSIED